MNIADEFNTWHSYLFTVAYNIIGEIQEAEDIVQDCFEYLLTVEDRIIQNSKAYLTRIVVNKSIDRIKKLKKERENYTGYWLPQPYVTAEEKTGTQENENISYSLLHAMEILNPIERAVFILREAFDFSYQQLAEICDISEENCRQILHRAKGKTRKKADGEKVVTEKVQQLLQSFLQACVNESPDELSRILKEDIVVYSDGGGKAIAALNALHGLQTAVKFLLGIAKKSKGLQLTGKFIYVNNQPGVILMNGDKPDSVIAIDLEGDKVKEVFIVRNPDKIFLEYLVTKEV